MHIKPNAFCLSLTFNFFCTILHYKTVLNMLVYVELVHSSSVTCGDSEAFELCMVIKGTFFIVDIITFIIKLLLKYWQSSQVINNDGN